MAQKLRVRTPKTRDGVNLLLDENNQVVYTESILELGARKNYESLNARLPQNLRHKIEVIEVTENAASAATSTNEDLKKRLADLELEDENQRLRDRIAELEGKSAGEKVATAGTSTRNAGEIVADIQVAESVEAVKALAEGVTFKTVQDAATKRIAELEGK